MNMKDRLVVLAGVVILVLASVGIYYWVPEEVRPATVGLEEFIGICGF